MPMFGKHFFQSVCSYMYLYILLTRTSLNDLGLNREERKRDLMHCVYVQVVGASCHRLSLVA